MIRFYTALAFALLISSFHVMGSVDSTLIKKAESGDGSAQLELADKYRFGEGVIRDHDKALKWYRLAAKQSYYDAIFALTEMGHPPENYRSTLWYPWTTFSRGYAEILNGIYPDYLFSDPFVTIFNVDTGESLKIPAEKTAVLMTLLVPETLVNEYAQYFDQLLAGNLNKGYRDKKPFETPYCFRDECGFLGLTTWGGGSIKMFSTDNGHFQEISTRYDELLQLSQLKKCRFGNRVRDHTYEVIETKEDALLLLQKGKTREVGVDDIRTALLASERKVENVFFVEVAGNQLVSFESGKNFTVEGSGRYANERSSLASINGQIKRMYFFPSIVANKFVARWNPDGAKFGDSLMIVNLETRDIHLLGDTTWGSELDEVFGTNIYSDGTRVGAPSLVSANLGSNNHELKLYPNHDYTGWIIETSGEQQQELLVYLPESRSLVNCER